MTKDIETTLTNEKTTLLQRFQNAHDKTAIGIDSVADKIEDSLVKEKLNKFEDKLKIGAGPLDWLRSFNNLLEGVPRTVSDYFDFIFKSGEEMPQKGVDMVCEYAAWFVNRFIEERRQSMVKSLYEQYGFMYAIQKKIMVVKNFFENPLSLLGAVVNAVKSILNLFLGPIAFVVMYMYNIVKEVIRLAENLANIAAVLPPEPPNPHINFNAFKLQLGKMGVSVLTEDPSQLPSPDEMFPKPIVPFSIPFWKALRGQETKSYKEEKPFYTLPSEETLEKYMTNYNLQ